MGLQGMQSLRLQIRCAARRTYPPQRRARACLTARCVCMLQAAQLQVWHRPWVPLMRAALTTPLVMHRPRASQAPAPWIISGVHEGPQHPCASDALTCVLVSWEFC